MRLGWRRRLRLRVRGPVSYTHLDVYKRQGYPRGLPGSSTVPRSPATGLAAMSQAPAPRRFDAVIFDNDGLLLDTCLLYTSPDRARQRAGCQRPLRTLRRRGRGPPARAVVLQDHRLRPAPARRPRHDRLARARQDDATKLDWSLRRLSLIHISAPLQLTQTGQMQGVCEWS